MPMRVTGMYSGLDTESIIQELVSAKQTKVDDAKKKQTKLGWKQEAWKELNTKLKNLQSKYLANMRFSDAYTKKKTTVSNSSVVSVIAGSGAMDGVQSLKVKQLAKSGSMIGGVVEKQGGGTVNALSKLSELTGGSITAGKIQLKTKNGDNTVDIDVNADTTISDVLDQMKKAGLSASFDEKNQRFFVNSTSLGEADNFEITGLDADGDSALEALGLSAGKATVTKGQDAIIELNGVEFKSNNNVFEINGLTITALSTTAADEEVTLSTANDTDGIYDMVKGFLKEYNSIINEIDKLYNAASAKGYEPLTKEEKEAMSESEIEEWEKKIKDSILRRDENLSTVRSALINTMGAGVEINGKTMHLFDFGIDHLGYFNAEENERNAFHIDGDPDDTNTMNNEDKLRAMITSDPDTVVEFFTGLTRNLYGEMTEMSKSVEGYRSFGSFYDDKKLESDYKDYESKIKTLEKKLTEYEDKWYAKFSRMETAMAKMQSNTNAITSLLGGA